ncbi:TetR/AcrR family transcriptional regulator [Novosphingopyxis sp.]|uniref:TetR/AcrR family transcriptional regulator n=1 Tax=Novosphingopyxis sp. TaxID=2709690 RepID=UPI003B5C2399
MGTADRKRRERTEREQRITAAARAIAEGEGWSAVTIRRLADEIEYSQPVLYSHFENRDAIITAVAVAGFRDLTSALRHVAPESTDRQRALERAATTYLAFAREHPALYEAMFTMPTNLRFAKADTRSELHDAFAALAAVVAPLEGNVEAATETFWATLHGLAELERTGRIRRDARGERVAIVVSGFLGS